MVKLGIDIGGTSVKASARDGDKILFLGQSKFYSKPDTAGLIDAIKQAITIPLPKVDAVGVCVPGLLDDARTMVLYSTNVPGLNKMPLAELVQKAVPSAPNRAPLILNDAVATGTDIVRARGLKGRVLVIALGTGVGAAVLDDGKPLFVEGASPGHIGQFDVSIEGAPIIGPDGGAGGLEGYIGVPALIQNYGSCEKALEQLDANSAPLKALVRAVRICHAIYRPQHIILAGGIGTRLKHRLETIRTMIGTNLTSVAREGWTLANADDDHHAARGASLLAGV